MSRYGKILFFSSWLSFAIMFAVRYVMGGWINGLYAPLVIGVLALLGALILDIKIILEFFTMKTTKHGMSMGTIIFLVLGILITVNYLAVKKNKTWDLTEDRIFSLSDQSVKVVKELKDPLKFVILYKGESQVTAMTELRESLKAYQDLSSIVQIDFFDAYVENLKAQEYLASLPDGKRGQDTLWLFVEHMGKRERVNAPFSEVEIVSAIIKSTRKSSSKIYFLTGHGERRLDSTGPEGLSGLKEQMEQSSSRIEELNLMTTSTVPSDASAIVIAGPTTQILENEFKALDAYLETGGSIVLMADPGEKHNISGWIKKYGMEFSNHFVLSFGAQVQGMGPQMVVAMDFNQNNQITKPFSENKSYLLMHLASEVRKSTYSQDIQNDFQVEELVKSNEKSISMSELTETAKKGELRSYSLAALSKGKIKSKTEGAGEKEFHLMVFSDSDFVSNQLASQPTNINLFTNAIAGVTGQTDLISITPRKPKATTMTLTRGVQLAIVGLFTCLPLLFIITGGVAVYRRRSA